MFSLKELFGTQVKVTRAESWIPGEPNENHLEIRCKRGTIFPYSYKDKSCGVETTNRVGMKILSILKDKARIYRRTDEGLDIEVPNNLVPVTFRYLKPKMKRQLSEASKQALRLRLEKIRANKSTLPRA